MRVSLLPQVIVSGAEKPVWPAEVINSGHAGDLSIYPGLGLAPWLPQHVQPRDPGDTVQDTSRAGVGGRRGETPRRCMDPTPAPSSQSPSSPCSY